MPDRRGKVAVITGGARGLGKAFGKGLAERGAHVVLVDVDGDEAERVAAHLRHTAGSAQGVAGDVLDEAGMTKVMEGAADEFGGIDLLINNAGLHSYEYCRPIAEMGVAKVRRLFDVNVMGVVTCTLAVLPHMKTRAGANIVNIGSSAAHIGGSAYGDSKLAVGGLTITFAREFGPYGIRVNAISPGMLLTEAICDELPEAIRAQAREMQAIDAKGSEADIVEAMLYLSSVKAGFITGETLRVSGGMGAGV